MKVSGILLFILILGGFSAARCGATVYPSNGSAASVQALHNAALNGDTITLPTGVFTWSTRVTITKAITLQGQGVGTTIIKDNVQSGPFLTITLAAGQLTRLTGFQLQNGGRTQPALAPGGVLHVTGNGPLNGATFRWDNFRWNNLNGQPVLDSVIGVIDHGTITHGDLWLYVEGRSWNGGTWGDRSWISPANYGSGEFLFLENLYFTVPEKAGIFDVKAGRVVLRHSVLHRGTTPTHGTESGGRMRGARAMEIYNNTFIGPGTESSLGEIRSGSCLIWGNTIRVWRNSSWGLNVHRRFFGFPYWGGADGSNRADANAPGAPFFTGTAAAASSGTTVSVQGSPNWTANRWKGYTLVRTSGTGTNTFAEITANGANTLSYTTGGGYGQNMRFAAGDSFKITKVDKALDMPGLGAGGLITGTQPVYPWPPGQNNQAVEACYSWDNTRENGEHVNIGSGSSIIRQGVHYFKDTAMPGYTPYFYPHPLTAMPTGAARALVTDFNGDGSPDYVLQRASTHATAIWYMNNNVVAGGDYGPTLTPWRLAAVADFNHDSHGDYSLFNPVTGLTGIWYLSGPTFIGGVFGPTLPPRWELVAAADFNGDDNPDYLLYNVNTRQTAIYYLNNNIYVSWAFGPTLPPGWELVAAADFNGNGDPDYLLYNVNTRQTAIYYLNNNVYVSFAFGPTLPPGWRLVAAADFNGNGNPDYLLYKVNTQETAIYYLNNNVYVSFAFGPTLPAGWSLVAP
jgi:hypothetical protein